MLELTRRDRIRVKTEIVELIALPFLSSTKLKLKFGHFTSWWFRDGRQKNVQKSMIHEQSCCFAN